MGQCSGTPTLYQSIESYKLSKARMRKANKQIASNLKLSFDPFIHSNLTTKVTRNCRSRRDIFFTHSIFTNKSILFAFTATYCRLNLSNYKNISIPIDIISLFCTFYDIRICESPKNVMKINDDEEHIFNKLYLSQTDLIGFTNTMKITVLSNLTMSNKSRIICHNTGTLILNVMGDIYIENESKLICPDGGNIFIKCNNLYLGTNKMDTRNTIFDTISYTLPNQNRSKLDGNIYMKIKNNMKIYGCNHIQSGNININCGGSAKFLNSFITITATKKNLKVKAKNIDILNKKGLKAKSNVILNGSKET